MDEKKEYAAILKEETQNAVKIKPKCIHFNICGGCDLQHISYIDQANAKKRLVLKIIKKAGIEEIEHFTNHELIKSPVEYSYRQRMDYVFAFDKAGLREKGKYDKVLEIEECPITPNKAFNAFKFAVANARELNLKSYDYINHEGLIRYFVVRTTKSGETLLSIVIKSDENNEDVKKIESIAKKIIEEKKAESVHILLQDGKADISFGKTIAYFGKEYIQEEILGKKFLIGPNTFFQSNPYVAELAFEKIRNYIKEKKLEEGADLYSGTATISIIVSGIAKKVISVDNNSDNRTLANKNIELNKSKNIEFIELDSSEYLKDAKKEMDFIIIDPPRVGLTDKTCARLVLAKPKSIIYMSCNPFSLARDLKIILKHYNLKEFYTMDMFPQTKHVETLAILEKKF